MRLAWLVFALILVAGCQVEKAKIDLQDSPGQRPPDFGSEGQSGDFAETRRVINVLYNDQLKIGDDRYEALKAQLDSYEKEGIGKSEIPELRTKLEALKVQPAGSSHDEQQNARPSGGSATKSSSTSHEGQGFEALVNEINEIFQSQKLVGPDHLARMNADLDSFEAQGADKARIALLREKVAGFNIPNPAPLNISSNHSSRAAPEFPSEAERSQLPDCAGLMLAGYPVDMSKVYDSGGVGGIGPPGHTFPTEHAHVHVHPTGVSTEKHDLYAPADVYILTVTEAKGLTQDPTDGTIYFALCKDIIGYYNHVKEFSPGLNSIMDEVECVDFKEGNSDSCTKYVFSKVDKGTVLGRIGGHQGNFDFGIIDLSRQNNFANRSRYGLRSLHVQCPWNYYEEEKRQKFFSYIERTDANRCGVIMQDIPGTLKGNWFYGDARADIGTDWGRHLGFLEEPHNPGLFVVSIGGTVSTPKKIVFTPVQSGNINRDFSHVKPDGNTYCFSDGSSKAVVKMVDSDTIMVSHATGQCSGSEQVADGFEYNR